MPSRTFGRAAALSLWLVAAVALPCRAALSGLQLKDRPAGDGQPPDPGDNRVEHPPVPPPPDGGPQSPSMNSPLPPQGGGFPDPKSGGIRPAQAGDPASPRPAPLPAGGVDGRLIGAPVAAHAKASDSLKASADAALKLGDTPRQPPTPDAPTDASAPGAADSSAASATTEAFPTAAGRAAAGAASLSAIYREAAALPAAAPAPQDAALLDEVERLAHIGDFDGAFQKLNLHVQRHPLDGRGWAKRSQALERLGRSDEALADAERAAKLSPDSAAAWDQLAWTRLKSGDYRGAVQAATEALRLDPNDALAFAVRARARWALGDKAGAAADAASAARLDPRFETLARSMAAGTFVETNRAPWADEAASVAAPPAGPAAPIRWPLAALLAALALGAAAAFRHGRARGARARTFSSLARRETGVVGGKYELRRLIGRGGMGEVHEAYDRTLKRLVAVKKISAVSGEEPERLRRMIVAEATTVASLHHPNIVDIYEIVESGAELHLVFELVGGKTLAQIVAAEGGGLPLDAALAVFDPVCRALQFAHDRQLVHRDLKPANIMVSADGFVKLMYFGIARGVDTTSGANTRTVMGSPAYMPPEAETGRVSKAGDIYALGATLYETLVGRPPFQTTAQKVLKEFAPAGACKKELPPELDELLDAALDPDPAKRPRSAHEFLSALRSAADKDRTPPARVAA